MNSRNFETIFTDLYGGDSLTLQKQYTRYDDLITKFKDCFGDDNFSLFSTPGRTEIGGNHTDHNHGRVLAASINLDTIAVAAVNRQNKVILHSVGYDSPFEVDLNVLDIQNDEKGTTAALIRGIAARLKSPGHAIGGFNAYVTSAVLPGSGLSSSAAIEVLIGTIFNAFFNRNKVKPEAIAKIGQYAENVYFGKPCGLMDQTACAVGGIITIDFKNPESPVIKKVNFDFNRQNYSLLVVDTGGNHADLTGDYAAVPTEMKSVAVKLGKNVCREIDAATLFSSINQLRPSVGDRAVLRAFHFLYENERVAEQVDALEKGRFNEFLKLVQDSGNSSFRWLQNIYTTKNVREQGVTLALALTENFLSEINAGACRVHGGGFAGTIQVFIPNEYVNKYIKLIEPVFGGKSVLVLNIRQKGSIQLTSN